MMCLLYSLADPGHVLPKKWKESAAGAVVTTGAVLFKLPQIATNVAGEVAIVIQPEQRTELFNEQGESLFSEAGEQCSSNHCSRTPIT